MGFAGIINCFKMGFAGISTSASGFISMVLEFRSSP
jgi:hypothetical protein